ncbi:RES family NAD+ phosphorylase [Wenzhouxiangella sp. EGI_FJ10305]|uniref:RES family NAD+ phosphorylase n=1 Tax=Wenzhouxiangella sp. EGI_FJ10305 TaxID=3243768 RepID=UPI0035E0942B
MSEDEIEPEVLAHYLICSGCIGEAYLKAEVERNGDKGDCTYCSETKKVITICDLADRVDAALVDHYERTQDEPTALQYALHRDKDIFYQWERRGEPVAEVICETAHIDERIAEHVRQVLEERHYDFDAAVAGEENPYDIEAHYDEKGVEDYELQEGWAYFQQTLKTETRVFNREAEAILDSIFEDLGEHITLQSDPVIMGVGPTCHIAQLYRARVFQSGDKLESALMRPDQEIGPPPFSAANAGRMNASGISVFYGATEPDVALAEVRPPVGSRVAVAQFEIIRPLQLLDVEALRSIYVEGSIFDTSYISRLQKAKFLRRLSDQLTMPVMPERESDDYLVTQGIADYLASREEPKIDGIIYRSIQKGDEGRNVVLFHKSSRVENLNLPEGTSTSAQLWEISENEPVPDYSVFDKIPDPIKEDTPYAVKTERLIGYENSHGGLVYFVSSPQQEDSRESALRIDTETVEVHHIDRIQVEATRYFVKRYKVSKGADEL